MGKLIRPARFRSPHVRSLRESPALDVSTDERALNVELAPVVALLFAASLLRVVRAVWCHEPFGTEPTFALLFVLGLPWLALHWRRKLP